MLLRDRIDCASYCNTTKCTKFNVMLSRRYDFHQQHAEGFPLCSWQSSSRLDFCETETSWTLVSFYTCNIHHAIIKMANFLTLFRVDRYIINITCPMNFMDFVSGFKRLNE